MSELNNATPEELVEEIEREIEDATVIPTSVDPTLSIPGVAADAKATGDAVAGVINGMEINGQTATNKKFTVLAEHIKMSGDSGAETVAQAIENVQNRDADEIVYDTGTLQTVKGAIDGIKTDMNTELTTEEIAEIFAEVFEGGEE